MSEGLPDRWVRTTLGELGRFNTSSVDKLVQDHEIPASLINYMDVYRQNRICGDLQLQRITATQEEHARFSIQKGDVLFTPSSETPDDIGHSAVVADSFTNALHSYHTVRLRPDGAVPLDVGFSAYFANGDAVRRYFSRRAAGSTRYTLSLESFQRAQVDLPPLDQQRRIAEVLATLDTAIEQTEALIAKTQQIKAGLMHDLFTRGVTPDGQLRPPHEEAPQLYKGSPFGWIPKEWNVSRCADLCTRICVGIVIQPTKYYVESGVPAFRSANVREEGVDPSDLVFISPESNRLLVKSQVRSGDVLTVRTGYPGTSAVVPGEFHGVNCVDVLISSPDTDVLSRYLCDWINSSFGKSQVLRQQGGMAQQHFNVGELRDLLVAVPPLNEQLRIQMRSDDITTKLSIERHSIEKLHAQRSGLMHDLLTGRVRVPVEAEEPVAAEA